MKIRLRKADRKFIASWSANMSATYTAALIVVPNLIDLKTTEGLTILIINVVYAIVFSILSIRMERRLL